MEKGKYGYLNHYKKQKIGMAAFLICAIAVMSTLVLIVFHTKSQIAIIAPIIMVLPFAKCMVSYIVVRSFSTMSEERYKLIDEKAKQYEACEIIYDITLSSEQGISHIDYLIMSQHLLLGCIALDNHKFSRTDIENYLKMILKASDLQMEIHLYENDEKVLTSFEKRYIEDEEYDMKYLDKVKDCILTMGV